jgi:hypothetical protein
MHFTARSLCLMIAGALMAIGSVAFMAYGSAVPTAAIDVGVGVSGCATAANTTSANSTSLTPDDMQSCVNPATGALNTGKLVETVVKMAGGGAFLVAAWIGIVGMHFPVGMPENLPQGQAEMLLRFRIVTARMFYVNGML